ncbi:MAG: hypothetical protein AB7O67_19420 [Vicinamibacterales bacterium]
MRMFVLAVLLTTATTAFAQESRIASDWRRERERIAETCTEADAGKLASCAVTLATDYPFHVALGNLAPGNGFAFGLAFVERYTPSERWKISFNADAVAAPGGSWRAGFYTRFIHTDVEAPAIVVAADTAPVTGGLREYSVFETYVQSTSLERVDFYGPDPAGSGRLRTSFGERQTIVGGRAVVPLGGPLRASAVGAVNGRFVQLRPGDGDVPSTGSLYDDARAPGISDQPGTLELQEAIRVRPTLAGGRVRLDYLAGLQQFIAGRGANASFHRWTIDLRHDIPLYRRVTSPGPLATNGPDECFVSVGSNACPPLTVSRNRTGSISLRAMVVSSVPFQGSRVPFYFQPTLGGSNIDGERLLAAYEDYRFRGPHLLVFQQIFEHSVWGPVGAYLMAEQGQVASRRSALALSRLDSSYGAGVSIRAGGLPVMTLAVAWGDGSGARIVATMDASLLGGSGRPSLF